MTEIFSEIDDELRRERLRKIWERYSAAIVGAAVLVVLAVGAWQGYEWWSAKQADEAGSAFEQAAQLATEGKHAEAEAAFTKLAATAPAGYRTLARLRAAAEATARDPKAGVPLYDAIAADGSVDAASRDLARIRAASLLVDQASYADMLTRLEAATDATATYHHTARELLALSAWRTNDIAAARKWLDMIAADDTTPPSLRQRAEAIQALLPPVAPS
ncbi:MAG: tetratricopeptide repeat protein [Xanthobacteraceae bacterium]